MLERSPGSHRLRYLQGAAKQRPSLFTKMAEDANMNTNMNRNMHTYTGETGKEMKRK